MTLLMMRRPVFDALSLNERRMESGLLLGSPLIVTDGVNEWACFDDGRFKLDDIAVFSSFGQGPPVRAKDIAFPDDGVSPWQRVLDANNAPATIRVESVLPDGWTPVVQDA